MKRKWLGVVLLGLGAFLLMTGVLTTVWAPGVVEKTPLDVNQLTHLDGTVNKLNPATGELEENPVKVQSITKTDSKASNDSTVVWVQTTCVVIDINDAPDCVDGQDPRLVDASTDVYATDRHTGESVANFSGLPADAIPHQGLVNKWPFSAQKKDYTYWDSTTGKAVPAVYTKTGKLLGIECYIYDIDVSDAPIQIAEGIDGTYDAHVEIWVEPKTGAIQQQIQSVQQYLDDGTQVVDLNVAFTDQQQKDFADDAKANIMLLDVVTVWMPIVGFVGGALCVLAGALLLLQVRRRRAASGATADREPAASAR